MCMKLSSFPFSKPKSFISEEHRSLGKSRERWCIGGEFTFPFFLFDILVTKNDTGARYDGIHDANQDCCSVKKFSVLVPNDNEKSSSSE